MKAKICILIVSMMMVFGAVMVMPAGSESDAWIQTTDSDFESGVLDNVEIVGTGDGAYLQLEKKNELGVWHEQQLVPSARVGSALAYDSKNNKVVLFGGYDSTVDDETWVYNTKSDTWTQKSPVTSPTARSGHAMAYDSANNKIVLFGGNDGSLDDETWVYDLVLDTWTQKTPSTSPSERSYFSMVYDAINNKIVLFGGSDAGTYDGETWVYDLASDAWTQMTPSTSPSARRYHKMAYDSTNGKIVLFGGDDSGGLNGETWTYDPASDDWTLITPSTSPTDRYLHTMAYDTHNKKVILFGGQDGSYDDETWVYDTASDSWTQKSPTTKSSARDNHAMTYDSANNKVVLFGGSDGANDDETWVYDLEADNWVQKSTSTNPTVRRCHGLAYDSMNNKVVLHGGWDAGNKDDTWIYDVASDTWTQMNPSTKPTARRGHDLVYDSANNKVVLFGGYDNIFYNDETWIYDVPSDTWTLMSPSSSPSERYRHAMAYDSVNNKVVLFGGHEVSGIIGETWIYDTAANTWTQMSPSTSPSDREFHTMTYDSANNKVILFGGDDGPNDDETWEYDVPTNTWTRKYPSIKPSARWSMNIKYDSANEKVILFGGNDGSYNDETWVYDLDSNNWTQKNPITKPSARERVKMTYDSTNKKIVLFGGNDGSVDDETWIYNYNDYFNSGTYTSKTFTSNNYKWHRITWGTNTDPDGFVRFQVAVNDDGSTWNYVGPDGTSLTYYDDVTGGNLYSGYSGKYLRYKAYFTTPYAGCTPKLHEVSIAYVTEKPSATLTSPNGGEDWMKGAYYPITWESEGDFNSTPVCLSYSTDNGETWNTILNWTENTGYYNWTVPTVNTASALIRVSVVDKYGLEESDCSDASFAIDPPPPISGAITSPGAGTIWDAGKHTISWNLGGFSGSIALEYSFDSEGYTEICSGLANTNSYSWDIPNDVNSKSVRIRLKAQDEFLNVNMLISSTFTIDTEKPVITHEPVSEAEMENAVFLEASVSDNFQVANAILYYNDGSGFTPVSLTDINGVYRGNIIPIKEGTIEYYITASDGVNSISLDVYQIEVHANEKADSEDESAFPWFIGSALICGIIAGIVIGLVVKRNLPKKEK